MVTKIKIGAKINLNIFNRVTVSPSFPTRQILISALKPLPRKSVHLQCAVFTKADVYFVNKFVIMLMSINLFSHSAGIAVNPGDWDEKFMCCFCL